MVKNYYSGFEKNIKLNQLYFYIII